MSPCEQITLLEDMLVLNSILQNQYPSISSCQLKKKKKYWRFFHWLAEEATWELKRQCHQKSARYANKWMPEALTKRWKLIQNFSEPPSRSN